MRIAGKEAAEEYRFTAWGHPGIKATHRTTLMLTKDADCTARGDCIIGVRADFDPGQLRELVKQEGKLVMAITVKQGRKVLREQVETTTNASFNDSREIVLRKTDFLSPRTLGIRADKSAFELNREMAVAMRNPAQKIEVVISRRQ